MDIEASVCWRFSFNMPMITMLSILISRVDNVDYNVDGVDVDV